MTQLQVVQIHHERIWFSRQLLAVIGLYFNVLKVILTSIVLSFFFWLLLYVWCLLDMVFKIEFLDLASVLEAISWLNRNSLWSLIWSTFVAG